jgi:hypothetical protein
LWEARPIVELRAAGRSPRELLSVMSQELEPVLPDETFVEAVLGGRPRISPVPCFPLFLLL